ncbi:MAG: hypothetical protein R8N23_19885 [Reichenbachiella sp.]|uniref:hypothetical protein n=1 Tax=Reichenbachiella sp. TaxID=2184521 RepID=UPI002965FA75|nr:hypothetical protein [Reichenbachiella sp.]MDW3212140.1 hypothetical protein [Reichenbachiella sp.]
MKYRYFLSSALIMLVLIEAEAQNQPGTLNSKPGDSRFLLRGYSDATFMSNDEETTFGNARFVPLFLYKQSDKLFFEGELEFGIEDGEVEIALEYANFNYSLAPNLNLRAGKILIPFGIFFDRLHPSWINRLPTVPLGYGHDGILPTSDLGAELRGASYLGGMKFNYSLYVMNGPKIEDGEEEAEEVGMIVHEPDEDNNNNKAVGGRLGLFPLRDQSLELGFSAQSAKLGNRDSELEDVGAFLYAFDWTYVRKVSFLGGIIDLKGQVNFINVDDQTYEVEEDSVMESYTFDNKSNSTFFQLGYRPTFGSSQLVKNLELVGRYSTLNTPEEAPWESESTQLTLGLNYWIDWRTAIKFAYQMDSVTGGHAEDGEEPEELDVNTFYIQWTLGF